MRVSMLTVRLLLQSDQRVHEPPPWLSWYKLIVRDYRSHLEISATSNTKEVVGCEVASVQSVHACRQATDVSLLEGTFWSRKASSAGQLALATA